MTYIRSINISVADVETDTTISPYINLVAAIFEQARTDWIDGWTKMSKIEGYYDRKMYSKDLQYLKTLQKDTDEYKTLSKKVNLYDFAIKRIDGVDVFLHSQWFQLICIYCNLDDIIILNEFERLKNNIMKNKKV